MATDTGTIFVVVGSTNPVKINAARKAFQQVFNANIIEASGTSVPSGVCDQPMSDAETKQGACQRALNAREAFRQSSITSSHFFVGMEGGVDDHSNEMVCFAWMAVIRGNSTAISSSRTATFSLPPRLRQLILDGMELGEADDLVFGRSNSKQDDGSVGLLTGGLIDRTEYYKHAFVLCLIPYISQNEALYNQVEQDAGIRSTNQED